jgi:hypothetical protein
MSPPFDGDNGWPVGGIIAALLGGTGLLLFGIAVLIGVGDSPHPSWVLRVLNVSIVVGAVGIGAGLAWFLAIKPIKDALASLREAVLKDDESRARSVPVIVSLLSTLAFAGAAIVAEQWSKALVWVLALVPPLVTFLGELVAEAGKPTNSSQRRGRIDLIVGLFILALPLVVLVVGGLTLDWWRPFLDLPAVDRVLVVSGIAAYLLAAAVSSIWMMRDKRRKDETRSLGLA